MHFSSDAAAHDIPNTPRVREGNASGSVQQDGAAQEEDSLLLPSSLLSFQDYSHPSSSSSVYGNTWNSNNSAEPLFDDLGGGLLDQLGRQLQQARERAQSNPGGAEPNESEARGISEDDILRIVGGSEVEDRDRYVCCLLFGSFLRRLSLQLVDLIRPYN